MIKLFIVLPLCYVVSKVYGIKGLEDNSNEN
jgi:hypothetical protein